VDPFYRLLHEAPVANIADDKLYAVVGSLFGIRWPASQGADPVTSREEVTGQSEAGIARRPSDEDLRPSCAI
jgi:hypothetical protein